MSEIQAIQSLRVKSALTGQIVPVETLWSNSTCVVHIMRRFGCFFTRVMCQRLSAIKPLLDAHHVRLVGIAPEELGLQDFLDGQYFTGELYIDIRKSIYRALGYKSFNWCTIWPALFCTITGITGFVDSCRARMSGNVWGDGLQVGGTLVVSAGGKKLMMSFTQDDPGHNVDPDDILKVLNISKDSLEISTDESCMPESEKY